MASKIKEIMDKDVELEPNTHSRIIEKQIVLKRRKQISCPYCQKNMTYTKVILNQIYRSYSINYVWACKSVHPEPLRELQTDILCPRCNCPMRIEKWERIQSVVAFCTNDKCSDSKEVDASLDGGKAAREGRIALEKLFWQLK